MEGVGEKREAEAARQGVERQGAPKLKVVVADSPPLAGDEHIETEAGARRRNLEHRRERNKRREVAVDVSRSSDSEAEKITRAFAQLSPGRSVASMTAVQRLYELCKATFGRNAVPSPNEVQRVRILLNMMTPLDVGLVAGGAPDDQRRFGWAPPTTGRGKRGGRFPVAPRFSPPITYLHLYECSAFSMGIFCLPTSAVIPLHNHPGMTVLSKLLYGSMHVHAFDWMNPCDDSSNSNATQQPRQAKIVMDQVLNAPCEATVLFPTSGGNIHAFTALTPCAILDVLAPPYCAKSGRHCTYYHEVSPNSLGGGHSSRRSGQRKESGNEAAAQTKDFGWLEPYEPEGVIVKGGVYLGPRVIPS